MPFIRAEFRVAKEGRTVIYADEDGYMLARIGGSPAWRNNNPGNLEYGKFAQRNGAIGSDGRFAIFPDEETGRRAKEALINNNYADCSIREMLKGVFDQKGKLIKPGYAPKTDNNDPEEYAEQIKKWTGLDVDKTKVKAFTQEQRTLLFEAMKRKEGTLPGRILHMDPNGNPLSRGTDKHCFLGEHDWSLEAQGDVFSDPSRRNHPFIFGKRITSAHDEEGLLG
jgi:hypothetical protein